MQLPPAFTDSYLQLSRYPLHIASKAAYGSSLIAYYNRLNRHAPILLIGPGNDSFVIPFKDIVSDTNGKWVLKKYNALSDETLKLKLGDTTDKDPNNPAKIVGAFATQPDPTCRFIFLVCKSALKPLELTRDSLLRILSYHQVMPAYIDFLLVYGTNDEDRELRFTGFRTRTTFQNSTQGHTIPDLHRSGRQHELCYNLKTVALKEAGKSHHPRNRWKIRQAAVYHRFDLGSGTALWIIGDPLETVKSDLQDVLPEGPVSSDFNFDTVPDAFGASLETHLVLVNWASASWRWHIQALEETIDEITRPAILFDHQHPDQPEITPRAVTLVQEYEDKVNETLMVIESNLKIFKSLTTSYTALVEDKNFPQLEQVACRLAVETFKTKVEEYAYDLQMQADRARVLSKVATDRKNIVFQQLQTQTAMKQEALASSMWAFSENSQKETIAMRIITVVTLVYLPPTFVCTFFGTDVIKYQDDGHGQVHFSTEALVSFFYVTIPLWVITCALVYYLYKKGTKKRGKLALQMVSKYSMLRTPGSTSTTYDGLKEKGS